MPPPLHPSPFSGLRSFLRPLLSLARSLARSFSLRSPPTLFVSYVIPTTLRISPPGLPPSLSLPIYLSIYLSLLRRTFSSSAPPLVAAVLARDTPLPFARCPCNRILSTPGFSSEPRSPRERFNGCLTLSPAADPFALSARDSPRVEISRRVAFSVRNNLHRTRSCETEP